MRAAEPIAKQRIAEGRTNFMLAQRFVLAVVVVVVIVVVVVVVFLRQVRRRGAKRLY